MAKSREYWEKIVREYEGGHWTQQQFAKRRGVAVSTLQYWLRRVRQARPKGNAKMLPVRLATVDASAPGHVQVFVAGTELRFSVGTDPAYIASVVRAFF